MGPHSKEAIVATLGGIIDELRLLRVLVKDVHGKIGTASDRHGELVGQIENCVARESRLERQFTEIEVRLGKLDRGAQ